MRKFVVRTVVFSGLALAVFLVALFLASTAKSRLVESAGLLDLDDSRTILILGDSHTECALNDRIISGAVNMSQSADCYLYSYVKLRELLRHNPQIDTVVVGYSYHNIARSQDNWLLEGNTLVSKLNRYYFLMKPLEIARLLEINPRAVTGVTTTIFKTSIETLVDNLRGGVTLQYLNIGRYLRLDRDKLQEALRRLEEEPDKTEEYSDFQKDYLIRIRDLCREQGRELMLIQTPKHRALREKHSVLREEYYRFHRDYLGDVKLLDYSTFAIPDSGFGDANHLNYKGAELFSDYIRENGFGQAGETGNRP